MNSNNIISKKKETLSYLSKRQLKNAFKVLKSLSGNLQDWQMTEKLNELERNYKFMLHYLFEGTQDAERENVYRNLLRALYEITDDISDELLKVESSNIFYERLRVNAFKTQYSITEYSNQLSEISGSLSLTDLIEDLSEKDTRKKELSIRRERIGSDIFNSIYISPRANQNDLSNYNLFLDNINVPTREKCLLISALTLSLCHRFDSAKLQILMHASTASVIAIKVRAIVGLIIVMQMYDVRWYLYPELQQQLDTLAENTDFKKAVLNIIIQLIRSRETEQISKKLTEEIIPEMMRFNSLAGRKLNMEELMSETDFSDKNPEWQKELEESGLGKKLQEYSNLQMEGADVFHSTFSGLKHFSFFSDMSNWFLPFDPSYSELSGLFPTGSSNTLLKAAVADSGHMCDSDKYSFCLSLMQIPASQREMMMTKLGAESEEIKQMQKDAKELNPTVDEEMISNQYIQNLYRFFKLNPYKSSFYDIFLLRLNFYEKQSTAPLISEVNSMKKIALYCFDKNHFKEALDIFQRLLQTDEANNDTWQKIGYCKQMLNDIEGALEAYLQADLILPNNSWTIKRIAQIYRTLKQPELSLEYYKKAAQITPDNMLIELNIGHCYLEIKDYEKALNTYFKVELLDSNNSKALRPIAWTAFMMKKFDLSSKYYALVLSLKPNVHDYLNAGHVELCTGNTKRALELYNLAARKENDFEQFITLFESDKSILIEFGIEDSLFSYLFDQIQYGLD